MSYYAGVPSYWLSRKEILERAITSKREKEARLRRVCEENCRYFNDLQTDAVKHDAWTSEEMCRISREARRLKVEKENKARILNERKMKLALMLRDEKEQLELELKAKCERRYKCSERNENDDKRKSTTKNIENEKETCLEEFYHDWLRNKQMGKIVEEYNGSKMEDVDTEMQKLELEEKENDAINQKRIEDAITRYINQLKMKEKEANRLKLELEMIQQKQWRLEELENEIERRMYAYNEKQDAAKYSKHQLKVHLQTRAREIRKQLEADWEMMRQAVEESEMERKQNDARREKNRKDAERFRKVTEAQIEEEKRRQIELDTLFNEEAGKVWKYREEQWRRERDGRNILMTELMDGLKRETEEKIAENLKQQEESVKAREDLLRMIDDEKEKMLKNQKKQQMQVRDFSHPIHNHSSPHLSLHLIAA